MSTEVIGRRRGNFRRRVSAMAWIVVITAAMAAVAYYHWPNVASATPLRGVGTALETSIKHHSAPGIISNVTYRLQAFAGMAAIGKNDSVVVVNIIDPDSGGVKPVYLAPRTARKDVNLAPGTIVWRQVTGTTRVNGESPSVPYYNPPEAAVQLKPYKLRPETR